VESHAGRHPPVIGGRWEVGRGVGRAGASGEKKRKQGKGAGDAVAAMIILNRRIKVGDGRRGGATRRARTERGGERGGPGRLADDARPAAARDRRVWVVRHGHAARPVEQGRGKGADRWAIAIVPGGGTG
jgi:hypothetical protein